MIFHTLSLSLLFGLLITPAVHAAGLLVTPINLLQLTDTTSASGSQTAKVAASWFAGWHAFADEHPFTLANVSWTKYTHMIYSFASTSSDGTASLSGSDPELLAQFVNISHENNVAAMLSVGGYDGSLFFSSSVATSASRSRFVQSVLDLVKEYDLDGLDFDWEYPNSAGVGCNARSPDDAANFLLFLQALRSSAAGSSLTLTASVGLTPWIGADGVLTNVSAFADVLDWVNIMNYDVWGSWDTTVGPNAPLQDSCAPSADQAGSAASAVAAWTDAGMPSTQIVLGVPSYGHSFYVSSSEAYATTDGAKTLAAYPAFNKGSTPAGDAWDSDNNVDACGVTSGWTGVFHLWGMIQDGYLTANGSVAAGIDYRFDNCSQTPYVYKPSAGVMISYDNAESFQAKGQFVAENDLRGFAMYETGGDYDDILLDAIRAAARLR